MWRQPYCLEVPLRLGLALGDALAAHDGLPALPAGGVVCRHAIAVRRAPGAPKCCAVRRARGAAGARTATTRAGVRESRPAGRADARDRPRGAQRFFSRNRLESVDRTVRGGQQIPVRDKVERADDSSESALRRPVTALDRNELLSGKARARRDLALRHPASDPHAADSRGEARITHLAAPPRATNVNSSPRAAGRFPRRGCREHRDPLPWGGSPSAPPVGVRVALRGRVRASRRGVRPLGLVGRDAIEQRAERGADRAGV